MHALLPEPETVGKLMHALLPEPGTPVGRVEKLISIRGIYQEIDEPRRPGKKTTKMLFHSILALSQPPRPQKCSFTASLLPQNAQSLKASQLHACPAARA